MKVVNVNLPKHVLKTAQSKYGLSVMVGVILWLSSDVCGLAASQSIVIIISHDSSRQQTGSGWAKSRESETVEN